jgi:His-Xaa-Ser system radical SAM maturase HxsB
LSLFPFKFQNINNRLLVTNDAGDFFFTNETNVKRLVNNSLDENFTGFLRKKGFIYDQEGDLYWNSHRLKIYKRKFLPKKISYFIIVPTLRCNLRCSYCQVSRVNQDAKGFDWSDATLNQFFRFAEDSAPDSVKIEFQGGEPTLRIDLIKKVITWATSHFRECEFVICTNLQNLTPDLLDIVSRDDVYISTSIDGATELHKNQRTETSEKTREFFENVETILKTYGSSKISALPTITDFEKIEDTIERYIELGFGHVFLRPVNFHGFARKSFPESRYQATKWAQRYRKALDHIFCHNYSHSHRIREFGFETALKRIFRLGHNGYVDLRSPNFAARDNIVVDYDGTLYPSDEARMVTRIGVIDLSIGSVEEGVDAKKLHQLNWEQIGEVNPDCVHCAYQPYCGTDLTDDMSRYNRIDIPKYETSFCRNQLSRFDDIFSRMISHDPVDILNISGHLTGIFEVDPAFGPFIYDQA